MHAGCEELSVMENGFGLITREVVTEGMRWNRDGLFFFGDFGAKE